MQKVIFMFHRSSAQSVWFLHIRTRSYADCKISSINSIWHIYRPKPFPWSIIRGQMCDVGTVDGVDVDGDDAFHDVNATLRIVHYTANRWGPFFSVRGLNASIYRSKTNIFAIYMVLLLFYWLNTYRERCAVCSLHTLHTFSKWQNKIFHTPLAPSRPQPSYSTSKSNRISALYCCKESYSRKYLRLENAIFEVCTWWRRDDQHTYTLPKDKKLLLQ